MIGSFVAGKATRDALFLFRFSARQLPYVDIAVALLVSVWVAIYIRVGQRVSVRTLISGSLVFFASNSVLFWFLSHRHDVAVGAAGRLRVGRDVRGHRGGAGVDAGELRPHHARGQAAVRFHRQWRDLPATSSGDSSCSTRATQFGAESTLIGMAVALLALRLARRPASGGCAIWRNDDPGDEEVREAASRGPAGLRESVRRSPRPPA